MISEIAAIINQKPGQTGIVYCLSRKDAEHVAIELQVKRGALSVDKAAKVISSDLTIEIDSGNEETNNFLPL